MTVESRPEMVRIWDAVASNFERHLDQIRPDDWDKPTPCPSWDVRQLVDHAISVQQRYGEMLGYPMDGPRWPDVRNSMAAGLKDDDRLATEIIDYRPLGTAPKLLVLGLGTNDLLVHTWDLSRAIGTDERLPVDAVTACLEVVRQVPEGITRLPTVWGELVETSDDAEPQTVLLHYVGRRP